MKQASEKAGRAEAGRRSSSLRTLTATELGDGSQVFSGGRGGRRDANVYDGDTRDGVQKTLCPSPVPPALVD